MLIQPHSKLVFIGDSITDAGRDPCGEHTPGGAPGFGNGYVSQINAILQVWCPQDSLRLINRGNSGDTIRDLAARWQSDVLDLTPDWLTVFIGVNDVWRQFDSPLRPEIAVFPEEFERTYRELLTRTRPSLKGLVLCSPFVIEPNKADPMRARIDEYGEIARNLAQDFNAVFVDVQAAFDGLCAHLHPMSIAWDRIHPGPHGHMAIARAWLHAMQFDGFC